jgi:hypothetical protein
MEVCAKIARNVSIRIALSGSEIMFSGAFGGAIHAMRG